MWASEIQFVSKCVDLRSAFSVFPVACLFTVPVSLLRYLFQNIRKRKVV